MTDFAKKERDTSYWMNAAQIRLQYWFSKDNFYYSVFFNMETQVMTAEFWRDNAVIGT